jgi:hypothetical protein
LVLTPSLSSIRRLEDQAVQLFLQYPVERWYNLGNILLNRQLLFGPRPTGQRQAHDNTMPPVLIEIYNHARNALLKDGHSPAFTSLPSEPYACAINRYPVSSGATGSGLGPHKDTGAWKPLVIGVTLVEDRKMAFTNGYKSQATQRHVLQTKAGSVYAFRDEMYTDWYHESCKKKPPSQKQTIYSITYRFPRS